MDGGAIEGGGRPTEGGGRICFEGAIALPGMELPGMELPGMEPPGIALPGFIEFGVCGIDLFGIDEGGGKLPPKLSIFLFFQESRLLKW